MTSSPDIEIFDAIAYITSHGLAAIYYPDEFSIRGGTEVVEVAPNVAGYVNGFHMTHVENSWIVHTKVGQIMCHVIRHTLRAAAEFVVRLYQETDQFDDETISIENALERFRASNFDVRFDPEKKGIIQICFGESHHGECLDGIAVAKRGRCFFALLFCRPSPVRKLVYAGDNLQEVVDFLCSHGNSWKADCN